MSVGIYVRGYCVETVDLADSFPEYAPTEMEFDAYEELFALYSERYLENKTFTEEEWAKDRSNDGEDYEESLEEAWHELMGDILDDFWGAVGYNDPNEEYERKFMEFVGEDSADTAKKCFAVIREEIKKREAGEDEGDI